MIYAILSGLVLLGLMGWICYRQGKKSEQAKHLLMDFKALEKYDKAKEEIRHRTRHSKHNVNDLLSFADDENT